MAHGVVFYRHRVIDKAAVVLFIRRRGDDHRGEVRTISDSSRPGDAVATSAILFDPQYQALAIIRTRKGEGRVLIKGDLSYMTECPVDEDAGRRGKSLDLVVDGTRGHPGRAGIGIMQVLILDVDLPSPKGDIVLPGGIVILGDLIFLARPDTGGCGDNEIAVPVRGGARRGRKPVFDARLGQGIELGQGLVVGDVFIRLRSCYLGQCYSWGISHI